MRKIYFSILISCIFQGIYAQTFDIKGFRFSVTSDVYKTVELISCSDQSTMNIEIPNNVYYSNQTYSIKSIASYAFSNNNSLHKVIIGDSVTSITNFAFANLNKLDTIVLGRSVNRIDPFAFSGLSSLKGYIVHIENKSFKAIDGVLFNKDQTHLMKYPSGKEGDYQIPNTVLDIESYAFWICPKLTGILISNSVITIGENGFADCTQLRSLTIPSSVSSIGGYFATRCSSLTVIDVAEENQMYSSFDGVLCDKNQSSLIKCPEAKGGDLIIPSSVKTIGNAAFYHCVFLTSLTLSMDITSIGSNAFNGCSLLKTLTIPINVKTIGYSSFRGCTSLSSIYAFTQIPIVSISSPYTYFDDVPKSTCVLYVPHGTQSAYKNAYEWRAFVNITEMIATNMESSRSFFCDFWYNQETQSLQIKGIKNFIYITLYDINGKLLINRSVHGCASIPMKSFPKGVYIVKILSGQKEESKKIVLAII